MYSSWSLTAKVRPDGLLFPYVHDLGGETQEYVPFETFAAACSTVVAATRDVGHAIAFTLVS